jgi:hypothetical protein
MEQPNHPYLAMQALISEPSLKATMDEFAHRAYQIADIMMEERQP